MGHAHNPYLYHAFDLLWFAALLQNRKLKLYITFTALPLMILIVIIIMDYIITMGMSLLLQLMIVAILVNGFLASVLKSKLLNWFLLSLIVYSIANVLKIIPFILEFQFGLILFNITSFLQVGFGVLFCFITINNSNWNLKSKQDDSSM